MLVGESSISKKMSANTFPLIKYLISMSYFLYMPRFMSVGPFGCVQQDEDLMKGSTLVSCFFYCKVIRKIKNNPMWQICFQKDSLFFSIITEKYSLIVLTPVERFDQGLMYYPVIPLIQRRPPFVLGRTHACQTLLWECYFSSHPCSKTEGDEKPNVPSTLSGKQLCKCNFLVHLK